MTSLRTAPSGVAALHVRAELAPLMCVRGDEKIVQGG
jgi:hypothetical protein